MRIWQIYKKCKLILYLIILNICGRMPLYFPICFSASAKSAGVLIFKNNLG